MNGITNYFEEQNQLEGNFNSVFVNIKECTDKILDKYEDKDFLVDPSVDIEAIAYEEGIKEIYIALPEKVNYEHSCLKNGIIYLNKENILEEWLFSIAHEIAHFLNDGAGSRINPIYRGGEAEVDPKFEILEKALFRLPIIIGLCSNFIAERVSKKIGKPVSCKNANIILRKMAYEYYSKNESEVYAEPEARFSKYKNLERIPQLFIEEMIKSAPGIIEKIYVEEIADYFAANLLVPTERFLLWEDKSDEAIAGAFNVTLGCIQKRREEIENELYFISPPKEHFLYRELKTARGGVVGIGKVKIPSIPVFDYNIKWLSFLDIQEAEDSFVSTCINLRIDGYGNTIEKAENDMFESIIYFLCQNFRKLPLKYAWENLYDLFKSDDWSQELWDVYHEAQAQLINKTELKNSEYQANEMKPDAANNEAKDTLADMIRKIKKGLLVHKTYFKVAHNVFN